MDAKGKPTALRDVLFVIAGLGLISAGHAFDWPYVVKALVNASLTALLTWRMILFLRSRTLE